VTLVSASLQRPERQVAPGALALVDRVLDHMVLDPAFLDRERTVAREPLGPALDREQAVPRIPDNVSPAYPRPGPDDTLTLAVPDRTQRPLAAPTYAEQFSAFRRAFLEQNPALDERQADWGAAQRLVRENPGLSYVPLVRALDQGGAAGQGMGGMPLERTLYIAQTAQNVLAVRESRREAGRGGGRT
jgi:hypothetical protein